MIMVRELQSGGVERDTSKLARTLDRKLYDPHIVTMFAGGFRHEELVAAGLPVTEVPLRKYFSTEFLPNARRLKGLIDRFRPDLLHSYDASGVLGSIVGRWARVPVIVTAQLSYRGLADPKTRWLLRLSDRLADVVIVNCDALRRHMIEDEHVPAEKVVRIYNGVETSEFLPMDQARPDVVADASLVIGCVSVFRKEKDLQTLVRAFARVKDQLPGMKLLLVGGGEEMDRLRALASELGISGQAVLMPGSAQVARWLRALDVFVLPSVSEAFSNALLEAMACGRACVASRIGGSPELTGLNGERGLLFDAGNVDELAARLSTLIADAELRRTLGRRAADYARTELNMERNVAETTALWQRLLDRKLGRRV
jgi:glycosyltransferase involved in cell wall biosynthesis